MKKTKINFGAILLIVYAVIAMVLSNISQYMGVYDTDMYLSLVNLNTFIGVGSVASNIMFVVMIAFGIALMCGKRWGALAMGASMATLSLVNIVPLMSIIGEIVFNDANLFAMAIPVLFFNLVTVNAALGWFVYALSGLFANIANNKGKISIVAIVLKILSVPGVVIAGSNQILFPVVMLAVAGAFKVFSDFLYIVVVFGLAVLAAQISLFILALGMILSVRCKPDCKAAKKDSEDKAKEEDMPAEAEQVSEIPSETEIPSEPEIAEEKEPEQIA